MMRRRLGEVVPDNELGQVHSQDWSEDGRTYVIWYDVGDRGALAARQFTPGKLATGPQDMRARLIAEADT